jgi:hypothetical protein
MEQTSDVTSSVSQFQFRYFYNLVHANNLLALCNSDVWLLGL